MAGLPDNRLCPTYTTVAVQQFYRVEKGLTCIALVPTRTGASTMGAGAYNEAVSKKAFTVGAVQLFVLMLVDISSSIDLGKNLLHNASLFSSACPAKMIELDIKPLINLSVDRIKMITKLLGCNPFLEGLGLSGSPILISAADVEGLIPLGATEPGKNVG
jgi:hypothetical protein